MWSPRRLGAVVLIAAGALALASCSSGSPSGTATGASNSAVATTGAASSISASGGGASAASGVAQSVLDSVAKFSAPNTSFAPPGPPVKTGALKGKKIFVIPSIANPFVQNITDNIKAADDSQGLVTTVFDNQGQISQWAQGIQQAIGSKQDLIMLNGCPDPRALGPQIAAAKAAGIPVICVHFYDNSLPAPPACEGCASLVANVTAPFYDAGKAAADWIIADSKGAANTLIVGGSDILPSPGTIKAMQDEFSANCPGCKSTVINIPVADWNTKTQGQVQSALQKDPTINNVYVLYDAMVAGALPAVQTLNRTDVKISSYNGSTFALDDIAKGTAVAMNVGEDTPCIGYTSADQAFRVLSKMAPVVTNTPIRIWDKTNVSNTGAPSAKPGVGYGTACVDGFKALWTS
jgi:ribose transport system substrate-binding protein